MTVRRRMILSAAALVAGASFVVLAVLVARHARPIERFDLSVHTSLRRYGLAHPSWLTAMRTITHLGDTVTIVAVDVTVVALCLWRSRPRAALFVAVVSIGVWALRLATRELVGRARPDDALWPAEGLSFPSGHATNSATMTAVIVIVCWPLLGRAGRIALIVAAVVYALSVALSRVAGGVHWPSDVLGGLVFAGAIVCAAAAGFPPDRPSAEPHPALDRSGVQVGPG